MHSRLDAPRSSAAALLLLAAYSLYFKCSTVPQNFWLFGDQMLHWDTVAGAFSSLPWHGTSRVDHGYCWGPIYFWVLWAIRHAAAPLWGQLPHIGALGLALINTAAEATLFWAMVRRRMPLSLAAAVWLLWLSTPATASLFGTLWNPNLGIAMMLLAHAGLLMWEPRLTLQRSLVVVTCATLAVHCHMPALFAALPAGLAALWGCAAGLRFSGAMRVAGAGLLLELVLHLPYLLDHDPATTARGPSELEELLQAPQQLLAHLHPLPSARFILGGMGGMAAPLPSTWAQAAAALALLLSAMALTRARRNLTPCDWAWGGALLTTFAGWTLWQRQLIDYWLVTVLPALLLLVACTAPQMVPNRWQRMGGSVLFILICLAQPWRLAQRRSMDVLPSYAALCRGAAALAKESAPLRHVLGPQPKLNSQSEYLYMLLGGRLRADAAQQARIDATGEVQRFTD